MPKDIFKSDVGLRSLLGETKGVIQHFLGPRQTAVFQCSSSSLLEGVMMLTCSIKPTEINRFLLIGLEVCVTSCESKFTAHIEHPWLPGWSKSLERTISPYRVDAPNSGSKLQFDQTDMYSII